MIEEIADIMSVAFTGRSLMQNRRSTLLSERAKLVCSKLPALTAELSGIMGRYCVEDWWTDGFSVNAGDAALYIVERDRRAAELWASYTFATGIIDGLKDHAPCADHPFYLRGYQSALNYKMELGIS